MTSPVKMSPAEITMLVSGIVLFVVAVGLLIFCVIKRRSFKLLLVTFPLAIIMIGFSGIKSAKVPGFEFDAKTADDFARDPNSASAREKFDAQLNRLEVAHAPGSARPLSPQVRSSLDAVANQLSRRQNLSPEARVTLSKAQLVLGRTNDASTNLQYALKHNSNLVIDPKLRMLVNPIRR